MMLEYLVYARLGAMLGLLSLILYSLAVAPTRPRPLIVTLAIYFGVSFCNQIVSTFVDAQLARLVIAYAGTPLIIIVAFGVWRAHLKH